MGRTPEIKADAPTTTTTTPRRGCNTKFHNSANTCPKTANTLFLHLSTRSPRLAMSDPAYAHFLSKLITVFTKTMISFLEKHSNSRGTFAFLTKIKRNIYNFHKFSKVKFVFVHFFSKVHPCSNIQGPGRSQRQCVVSSSVVSTREVVQFFPKMRFAYSSIRARSREYVVYFTISWLPYGKYVLYAENSRCCVVFLV